MCRHSCGWQIRQPADRCQPCSMRPWRNVLPHYPGRSSQHAETVTFPTQSLSTCGACNCVYSIALKPAQRAVHSCNGLALMEQRGPKLAACRRRYRNALHYSKRRLDSKYPSRYGTSAAQPLHCPHRLAGSTRAASTASTIPRPSVPHRSILHALTAAAEAGAPPTLQWAAAAGSPSIPMGVRPSVPVAANRAGW